MTISNKTKERRVTVFAYLVSAGAIVLLAWILSEAMK